MFALLQAAFRDRAEQAIRLVVSTLPTRTWRLHDLFGSVSAIGYLTLTNLKSADEWPPAHCKMIIARSLDKVFLIIVDPALLNA